MTSNYFISLNLFILIIVSRSAVMAKNSIFSLICMVATFVGSSVFLIALECDFMALVFLMVYVGALSVLFLFVVMMLDLKSDRIPETKIPLSYGILFGFFFFFELLFSTTCDGRFLNGNPYSVSNLFSSSALFFKDWYSEIDNVSQIGVIGQILYTHYFIEFLCSGLILFLAAISSVSLNTDGTEKC